MRQNAQRSRGGKHRKVTTSQTSKGRVALVAVAAGAASSASIGGATAAQLQADNTTVEEVGDYELAVNAVAVPGTEDLPEAVAVAVEELSPQILPIAEYKPVAGLESQLDKAIRAAEERAAADLAARAPSVARPAEGAFTSGFGPRWGAMHNGIDIANAEGTPILSVMDGTVIDSGPASGYGNWIRVLHDDGSMAVYGHMSSLNVGVGERVHAGQNIAGMGNLGFSTGTHLHFEIHPAGMGPVDPIGWFAERGIAIS